MIKARQNGNRVVTGEVRLSYAHLFEPYANNPGDEAKYSVTLVIPKTDTDTLNAIKAAQDIAAEAGKASKFAGKIPPNLSTTLHDGDLEGDLERNPEYKGCMYMSVNSKTRPGLVDRNALPIADASELYSGCYALVAISAFAYNTQGNRGISFGLDHVQKVRDGDALDGRVKAEDVFGVIEDEESVL